MAGKIERLRDIRCFLLDMDGTFYLGDRILEGSLDFIKALEERGIGYLFLTNNSSKSARHYVQKLKRMGLDTDRVLTSGQAAAMYLRDRFGTEPVYLLGNDSLREEMGRMGVNVVEEGAKAVCIGYDTTFTYRKMCALCDYIRKGLPYIATHPDFNCPVDSETGFEPDIGAIIAYVKASTGREPDVVIGSDRILVDARARWSKAGRKLMVGVQVYRHATGEFGCPPG